VTDGIRPHGEARQQVQHDDEADEKGQALRHVLEAEVEAQQHGEGDRRDPDQDIESRPSPPRQSVRGGGGHCGLS
jgi:hypothetical protein